MNQFFIAANSEIELHTHTPSDQIQICEKMLFIGSRSLLIKALKWVRIEFADGFAAFANWKRTACTYYTHEWINDYSSDYQIIEGKVKLSKFAVQRDEATLRREQWRNLFAKDARSNVRYAMHSVQAILS